MNKTIKHILGSFSVLLAIGAALWGLGNLVQRKDSDYKYHDFFAQEEDFDVLFLGTSHIINGVFPMELWKDYGIVSYNFGGHANRIATSYWVMENALAYTTPKLIVMDIYYLCEQEKTFEDISYLHISLDTFPFTLTKCRAVMDLLDDPFMEKKIADGTATEDEKREPMGFLWDFSVYHPRWTYLEEDDFAAKAGVEKGAESRIGVIGPRPADQLDPITPQNPPGDTVGEQYLRRLIERCQSRGIDILLTYMPMPPSQPSQQEAGRGAKIAAEYGVGYIDFLDMDVVDYGTDMYDGNYHLNPSGARKVTEYLGRYITEYYDIPDRRQDPAYSSWYDDYETYTGFKEDNIREQTDLKTYLMLLADKNYDCIFYLKNSWPFQDGVYRDLLENLGVDTAALEEDGSWLITRQGGQKAQVWAVPAGGTGTWATALGELQLCDGTVTLDGALCMARPASEKQICLQAAVLAAKDHHLVDTVDFDVNIGVSLREQEGNE